MFPYTDTTAVLQLHAQRTAELRAEAARYRLARAFGPAPAHRRPRWWSRLAADRPAATRVSVHP